MVASMIQNDIIIISTLITTNTKHCALRHPVLHSEPTIKSAAYHTLRNGVSDNEENHESGHGVTKKMIDMWTTSW